MQQPAGPGFFGRPAGFLHPKKEKRATKSPKKRHDLTNITIDGDGIGRNVWKNDTSPGKLRTIFLSEPYEIQYNGIMLHWK
ncbi:MAG: hypothetical protein KH704_03785 [Clostridiales bacterium]|nr:hypothetical protein [Clostridiales bacterium]